MSLRVVHRQAAPPVAVAVAILGASLLGGAPTAHADDPLAPIITSVIAYRSNSGCPKLTYDASLEAAAQKYARSEDRTDGIPREFNGQSSAFLGSGDPQASAILSAYARGARGVAYDCATTDFGVGFIRHEDRSVDVVTMVFGQPADVTYGPPVPAPVPVPAVAPVQCPVGSPTPTVPAGGTCAEVVPPTGKVSVSLVKGFPQWTVNVINASAVAGTCTYTANGPGGGLGNRSFGIAPNGSVSFPVPAPLPLTTYHVVTSCHGTFNGKDVEFGHDEQDARA